MTRKLTSKIFPSYGIAASAAALAIRGDARSTIQIDRVALGWLLTIRRPKPMKVKPIWIRLARREPCTQVQNERKSHDGS
jgi:hypothetical protein